MNDLMVLAAGVASVVWVLTKLFTLFLKRMGAEDPAEFAPYCVIIASLCVWSFARYVVGVDSATATALFLAGTSTGTGHSAAKAAISMTKRSTDAPVPDSVNDTNAPAGKL